MFKFFKLWLVALSFMFLGNPVFAVDYYWTSSSSQLSGQFISPDSGCDAWVSRLGQLYPSSQFRKKGISWGNSYHTAMWCNTERMQSAGVWSTSGAIDNLFGRNGTSCPSGSTFNDTTGACDAPEESLCQQAKGANTIYWFEADLSSPLPDTIDINGCIGKLSGVASCPVQTSGQGVCSGQFTITGDETSAPVAGTGNDCSSNCNPPYPQVESSELPCDPVIDPVTGASVCTSETHFSQPGTMTCGTANDKLVCTENPKSVSQDKTVETSTKTTNNADGSTSTTTTTTTTKTDCLGVDACTSTSSVETTDGGTKTDGSAKPETSTCTGDGCDKPEDIPTESLSSGELVQPERGDFADELAEMDQLIADSRVDLRGKLDQMAELVTAETQLSFSSSAGQLYCQSVPVPALGTSLDICFSEFEDELVSLKWVILFLAAVLAFYIIFLR